MWIDEHDYDNTPVSHTLSNICFFMLFCIQCRRLHTKFSDSVLNAIIGVSLQS